MIRREVDSSDPQDVPSEAYIGIGSGKSAEIGHRERDEPLIPNIILFNYKVNLLTPGEKTLPGHRKNINKTVSLHPGASVLFYDNAACRASIVRIHSEDLAHMYDRESKGMYKSDLCRYAMLYEHGGYYFDNDLDLLQDVRRFVPPTVGLSSVIEETTKNTEKINLFQAFLAAAPRHPVLKDALERTYQRYMGEHIPTDMQLSNPDPDKGHLGPSMSGAAARAWLGVDKLKVGYMVHPGSIDQAYFFQERADIPTLKLFNLNRDGHKGTGCCCQIAVGDNKVAIAWSRFVGAGEGCALP